MSAILKDGQLEISVKDSVYCLLELSFAFGRGLNYMISSFQSMGGSTTTKFSKGKFNLDNKMDFSTTEWILTTCIHPCYLSRLSNGTHKESMLKENRKSTSKP
jgi:hypothetical protein